MVSEVEKGIKTKLIKDYRFLNIGNFYPVAIFGGISCCAAIDLKGAILYIRSSYDDISSKLIEPKYLPNNEKAVDIACLTNLFYVLSSTGKLYVSKNKNYFNFNFKQVNQFKKINIVQISGIFNHILVLTEEGKVYSQGQNLFGELGTGDTKSCLKKFHEISALKQYKIISISAGENHSMFLTSEGKVFSCGNNESNQCFYNESLNKVSTLLPTETIFQKDAKYCISSFNSSLVCIGFDPEMSPNRRIKDEINILSFGFQKKTEIIQSFVNNNFENSIDDNEDEEDYYINLEVNRKIIKLNLIDAKNIDGYKNYYQRSMNLIYFFDNSNQTSSFDEIDQIYEEANKVWDNDIKLVFVNCINANSPKLKYDKIKKKYKCEVFEIDEDKNIENINKPFFSFLPKINKSKNEILKIGKEYRNPFNNIKKDHLNIGLFGSKNVKKTDLAYRYIYDDVYKIYYDDFISNFADNDLDKVVEIKNELYNVSILDSTFVNNKEDDFGSYYSIIQGIIFVFQIDLLSSSSDFINEINKYYINVKESVEGKLNIIIAFKVSEDNQINDLYHNLIDKIEQIEERFQSKVFLYSIENSENNEEMFYYLLNKIVQTEKGKLTSKKKHYKKKKTISNK